MDEREREAVLRAVEVCDRHGNSLLAEQLRAFVAGTHIVGSRDGSVFVDLGIAECIIGVSVSDEALTDGLRATALEGRIAAIKAAVLPGVTESAVGRPRREAT